MFLVWTLTRWDEKSMTGCGPLAGGRGVLNTGAPTRAGYGEGLRLTAPDVAMAHGDLGRRFTWAVGEDLGSDHFLIVISGLPRRTRRMKWAFHKDNWPAFTEDCEQEMARIPVQDLDVEALSNVSARWSGTRAGARSREEHASTKSRGRWTRIWCPPW